MLIRSQNKEILVNLDAPAGIEIAEGPVKTVITSYITGCSYLLGEYSTKEKAIKALDMLQESCDAYERCKSTGGFINIATFQMPEDGEVK
jgi:hypothetical protein